MSACSVIKINFLHLLQGGSVDLFVVNSYGSAFQVSTAYLVIVLGSVAIFIYSLLFNGLFIMDLGWMLM